MTEILAPHRPRRSQGDLLGGLFRQMNTAAPARAGRYAGVAYFNGGLFSEVDAIELLPAELAILANAANRKWDLVKPEIFGTLFQASMDDGADPGRDERHAYQMPKDADILAFLLELNQSCAAKEASGESITPPGLPLAVEEHEKFITSDCIRV